MIGSSRHIERELRHDFTAHAFRLSPRWYDQHRVGEIMALATNDINAVRTLLGPGIMYLVQQSFTAVVAASTDTAATASTTTDTGGGKSETPSAAATATVLVNSPGASTEATIRSVAEVPAASVPTCQFGAT